MDGVTAQTGGTGSIREIRRVDACPYLPPGPLLCALWKLKLVTHESEGDLRQHLEAIPVADFQQTFERVEDKQPTR